MDTRYNNFFADFKNRSLKIVLRKMGRDTPTANSDDGIFYASVC